MYRLYAVSGDSESAGSRVPGAVAAFRRKSCSGDQSLLSVTIDEAADSEEDSSTDRQPQTDNIDRYNTATKPGPHRDTQLNSTV